MISQPPLPLLASRSPHYFWIGSKYVMRISVIIPPICSLEVLRWPLRLQSQKQCSSISVRVVVGSMKGLVIYSSESMLDTRAVARVANIKKEEAFYTDVEVLGKSFDPSLLCQRGKGSSSEVFLPLLACIYSRAGCRD